MKKIRIAQIGTSVNSHGNFVFDSLRKADDMFDIAGYAMPQEEDETHFKDCRKMSVDEILNDPSIEAVTIETEEEYLTKYALLAAEHGKHIHMEKPGGTKLCEFEKLIETARKNNLVFHTGYMYRYNPAVQKLIKEVRSGEFGEIISVEAQMNCRHSDEVRKWLAKYKGGIMFFLGCHLVDLILLLKGKPDKIIPLNKSTGMHGINSTDFGMAALEYENGVSFAKVCDIEKGGFLRRQLVVTGTEKTAELKPLEIICPDGNICTEVTECSSDDWVKPSENHETEKFDRYLEMMRDFARIIRGETENKYSYDYELELYKTVLECCKEGY